VRRPGAFVVGFGPPGEGSGGRIVGRSEGRGFPDGCHVGVGRDAAGVAAAGAPGESEGRKR